MELFTETPTKEEPLFLEPETGLNPSVQKIAPAPEATPQISRAAMMAALEQSDVDEVESDPQNYLATLMETKQAMEEQITLLGDSTLRMEMAQKERLEEIRDAIQMSRETRDEMEANAASLFAKQSAFQDMEEKSKTASEKRTMDTISRIALRYPYAAAMYEDSLDNPGTLDAMREEGVKRLLVQDYIDSFVDDDRNTVHKVADWTVDNLLVFWDKGLDITGNTEVEGQDFGGFFDNAKAFFLPGVRREAEAFKFENLSIEEMPYFLDAAAKSVKDASTAFGYTNKTELKEQLNELLVDTPSVGASNLSQIVEIASVIPVGKAASVSSTLIRGGAREAANNVVATAARIAETEGIEQAAKKTGMSKDEIFESLLPTAMKNLIDDGLVATSTDAGAAWRAGREQFEEFVKANSRSRMTEGERTALDVSLREQVEKVFPSTAVKDVKLFWEQTATGSQIPRNSSIIGKTKGEGGYTSKSALDRVMKKYGVAYKAFKDEGGEWYGVARLPIKEEGYYTAPLEVNASTIISKFLRGGGMQSDDMLQGAAVQGGRMVDKLISGFEGISYRNYGRLSRKDRGVLDTIFEIGRDTDQGWLTTTQLKKQWEAQTGGAPMPPRVQEAYYDFKRIMDITYYVRNQDVYKRKALQGMETVEMPFELGTKTARVSRDMGDIPADRVYNISDGQHFVEGADTAMTPERWKELQKQGYMKVSTEEAVALPDGTYVKEFIGKKSDFKVSPLSHIQVPYREGIHRMYEDAFFVKSANILKQGDTGKEVLGAPRAYRTFPSRQKAEEWAETMNAARKAYNDAPSDVAALARIFGGRSEYPSPKEFIESIKSKKVDPTQEFEAVEDGVLPAAYSRDAGSAQFYTDPTATSLEQLGVTQGRMYTSSRGDRLLGYDGKEAPVLSPAETINRAAMDAARIAGYSDYVIESTTRMLKTFEPHIDANSTSHILSPQARIKYATLKQGTRPEIAAQWEAQKAIIGRVLNQKSPFDEVVENWNRTTQDFLAEMGVPGVKVARFLEEANPFAALRGFAFHMKLGLFNPAQFVLQVSSSLQAALLSPDYLKINPFQAYAGGLLMRFGHEYGPKASALLDNPAFLKATGFADKASAKEALETFSESGLLNVNNSHQLANTNTGGMIGAGRYGATYEKAKKVSGTFFYEPEKINRSVAFMVAWREVENDLGKRLLRTDGPSMKKVFDKTETYSFQMATESRSAFQKGPASLATQFFAYPIRMLELTFTGKKLTRNQKVKLLAGQLALYGSSGFVLTEALSDKIQKETGQTAEKGTAAYVLDRGLVDTFMNMGVFAGDETDINLSDRIGTGAFALDLIKELFNVSPYGDTSFMGVVSGVGGQTVSDSYEAFNDLLKYGAAVNGQLDHPQMQEVYLDMGRDISTVNNLYRGYTALKYQQLKSKEGTVIDENVTTPEAFALLLGINNSTMNDTAAMMEYMKDDREIVKENAKLIRKWREEAFTDPAKADASLAKISALQNMTDDDMLWYKSMKESLRYSDMSAMYEQTYRRYEKEKATKDFSKRLDKRLEEQKGK